ncbi:glutathione S-transferase U9-like [Quercus robur]|uniref:glutathione S-transferase U9-like n=1 Tax=Quercus robur TaxID=38942 RepID=UPI0021619560|nr:glutathione S-transferase U9-like [Quercus robur]
MAEENKVSLHGFFASPYVRRVELALKFKGIPYEYVEEDLKNKSSLLLKYNPVHKKVPVLVHNGKPIVESLIILEYIDETWKNRPRFLPEDPYKRAQIRFWASFVHQQVFENMVLILKIDGEAQEKAVKEVSEKLSLLEEGIKSIFPEGIPIINQENVGLLDIVIVSTFGSYKAQEEVLGLKLIDPEKTSPLLFSRLKVLLELPVVKGALPPHEKVVGALKFMRQNALNSASV